MFIDIHHHLIYGVDDGAETFEGTQKMIRQAVENQVHAIITTPHIVPGQAPFDFEKYKAHLEETRQYLAAENIDLTLYTGSEVLYTPSTAYQLSERRVPTLAGTRFLLVEFSPDDTFDYLLKAGLTIAEMGYIPVYAHVERYECLKKPDQIQRLRDETEGLIQVNANTVIRKHSFFRQRFINRISDDELVDFIGTDCHDLPGRDNHMADAFDWLFSHYGEDMAHALTHGNAEKLLARAVR
jgi:protein-tyrosine phosphatase